MKKLLQLSACLSISFWSSAAIAAPEAPTELVAKTVSGTQITLTWKDNSKDETGFKITRRRSGKPDFVLIHTAPANTTSFQDTNLDPGGKYYYHVAAASAAGDSELSLKAEATTTPPPPVPPAKVTATAVSGSRVTVTWESGGGIISDFKIERKTSGGTYAEVKKVKQDVFTFQDFRLTEATQYTYRVRSANAAGDSAYSNEASVTTLDDSAIRKNPGDLWAGTYQKKMGTKLFTWIPSREATIEITPSGRVKLICPETKPASNGGATCERFVYDENYRELDAAYLKELFSSGVSLPDGHYAFHIRYAKAPKGDYKNVDDNVWAYFHGDGYQKNCADSEMVSFSVEGNSKPSPGEIVLPAEQRRVSYVASYMYLNNDLVLPPNKDFGVSRFAVDLTGRIDELGSLDHLFSKKITHMNDTYYPITDNFSADYCWRAARCETGHTDEELEATVKPGETWTKTIQTNARDGSGSMIGDWHRHHFSGDLKGCKYWSEDLGDGKLRFNIKNETSSTQTVKGGVRVRMVWKPQTAADNMPLSKKFIFIAEFAENGMGSKTSKDEFAMIEEAFKKYYERLQKAFNVTSPAETNIYFDYFQHLYGFVTSGPPLQFTPADKCKAVMATPESAQGDSKYYKLGSYKFRNRQGGVGYMDNPSNTGEQVYAVIYGLETNFIANPDTKVAGMAWQSTDGTPGGVTAHGIRYRKKFPGGDIIQKQDTGHPHEIMKARAFFHMLLGNSHLLWEAGARFSKDLSGWSTWATGDKTYWQPEGGKIVEWQEGLQGAPVNKKDNKFGFPNAPQVGEQGAWLGAYLYSLLSTKSDRVSKSIQYPVFSYSISGGQPQTGYAKSNEPTKGKLGAEVSRFGVSNPGQDNIVDSYKSKKPIVMLMEGKAGHAVVIKNIWVKPTDIVSYKIKIGSTEKVITHTGRLLGVYAINAK